MSLAEDNKHMVAEIKKLLLKIDLSKDKQDYINSILDDVLKKQKEKPESV